MGCFTQRQFVLSSLNRRTPASCCTVWVFHREDFASLQQMSGFTLGIQPPACRVNARAWVDCAGGSVLFHHSPLPPSLPASTRRSQWHTQTQQHLWLKIGERVPDGNGEGEEYDETGQRQDNYIETGWGRPEARQSDGIYSSEWKNRTDNSC